MTSATSRSRGFGAVETKPGEMVQIKDGIAPGDIKDAFARDAEFFERFHSLCSTAKTSQCRGPNPSLHLPGESRRQNRLSGRGRIESTGVSMCSDRRLSFRAVRAGKRIPGVGETQQNVDHRHTRKDQSKALGQSWRSLRIRWLQSAELASQRDDWFASPADERVGKPNGSGHSASRVEDGREGGGHFLG